jgi:hypothetical protein
MALAIGRSLFPDRTGGCTASARSPRRPAPGMTSAFLDGKKGAAPSDAARVVGDGTGIDGEGSGDQHGFLLRQGSVQIASASSCCPLSIGHLPERRSGVVTRRSRERTGVRAVASWASSSTRAEHKTSFDRRLVGSRSLRKAGPDKQSNGNGHQHRRRPSEKFEPPWQQQSGDPTTYDAVDHRCRPRRGPAALFALPQQAVHTDQRKARPCPSGHPNGDAVC